MRSIDFGKDEDFINNYKKLKSARKMGDLYNCNKTTILNHAKKIGYNTANNKEKKITLIPIEQVIKDYETLKSAEAVGKKYNCSGASVRQYLIKNNYNLTNYNAKLKNVSAKDFINKYEELKNTKDMADFYKCSTTAILNYAKKIGYDTSKKLKFTEEEKQDIIKSYQSKTSNELAKKYNTYRGIITKIWYDNNLVGKTPIINKTVEKNITGQQFGFWTVLYKTDKRNAGGIIYWHCKCKCGIEKDVLGSSLRQGLSLSCGNHSNISKGNEKIKQILQKAEIPFEIEKKFPSCKDKKLLPFDFYVNNSYLIEYDGIQHFQKSIFDYDYTHKHDLIKNQWCIDNNIHLIRIPYTHLNKLSLQDLLLETTTFLTI